MSDAEERPSDPDVPEAPPEPPKEAAPQPPRKLRPWYLIAAMCVMWIMGVFGATSGCTEVSYLRGSHEMTTDLERGLEEATHPWVRIELVRQQARLVALATMYQRAFPLSAARMLLCLLLVLAAGSAIAGRVGARNLALQAVVANALLMALTFAVLTPVRQTVADAVAEDTVDNGGGMVAGRTHEQSLDFYRQDQLARMRLRAGLELSMFALAAVALTRRRTKMWFSTIEDAMADTRDNS